MISSDGLEIFLEMKSSSATNLDIPLAVFQNAIAQPHHELPAWVSEG